eukprot:12430166-Karenia_brevis.AAC.2
MAAGLGFALIGSPQVHTYIPLAATSNHPPNVHVGWPVSIVTTYKNHSSSKKDFQNASLRFIQDLSAATHNPEIVKYVKQHVTKISNTTIVNKDPPKNLGKVWLKLKWHPVFNRCKIGPTIHKIMHDPYILAWKSLLGIDCAIGIAWQKAGKNLGGIFNCLHAYG